MRVNDQRDNPIRGAFVLATVHYPTSDQTFTMPATDEYGSTVYTFPIDGSRPGQLVIVAVSAGYLNLPMITTETTFMVWF